MQEHRSNLTRPIPRLMLNEAELALSLGVATSSVREMVEEGRLPRPRRWHRRRLYLVAEVDAALANWPSDGEDGDEVGKSAGADGDDDRWKAEC